MKDWIEDVIATAAGKLIFFLFDFLTASVLWWIASPKFDHSTKWAVILFFSWVVSEIQWVGYRMTKEPLGA